MSKSAVKKIEGIIRHGPRVISILPDLPDNKIEWIKQCRPYAGGLLRNFDWEPFWIDVYEDPHPNIIVKNARQTFKSTFATDILAHGSTHKKSREVTGVFDNETRLAAFSEQRLRRGTFLNNPTLAQFLPQGLRANIGRIILNNGSIIYLRTDEREYGNVEGLTNDLMVFDECQYQDIQFLPKALYTMSQTQGRLYLLGIGGEAGSEWHKLWLKSDQRRWVFNDPDWRDKLKFDNEGQLVNEHPENIVAGRWVSDAPNNQEYHGYAMPQRLFARIPLTIDDAIKKYRTRASNAIEYQKKNFPMSIYLSHTEGDFFKATRRPITPEMVQACYCNWLTLLTGKEVKELKSIYGNSLRVLMGVDFGSNPAASQTFITILLHWRKSGRYQLAWIEGRPQEHQLDQSAYIAGLGHSYGIDYGVGDLGYGQIQVKVIQDGGRDSKDVRFDGLGSSRFSGCRTIGSEVKPSEQYHQDTDEHGTELGRIQIDKTTSIQMFVDFIGWFVMVDDERSPHIELSRHPAKQVTKFMIPSMKDWETDFLLDDYCATTRKDLDIEQDVAKEDPRQKPKKEFNHPRDSMMSNIYSLVADNNYQEGAYTVSRVRKV